MVQWLNSVLLMQGRWVQSLVREVITHMIHNLAGNFFLKKESLNVEEGGRKVSEQCNEKNVLAVMAL